MIVHPSAREAGRWQVTSLTRAGEVWGHVEAASALDAVASCVGVWVAGIGCPIGGPEVRVREVLYART
jgi:hypothetical protein